jgi:hypothetical protein
MPQLVIVSTPVVLFDYSSKKEKELTRGSYPAEWIQHPNSDIGGKFLRIMDTTLGCAESYLTYRVAESTIRIEEN